MSMECSACERDLRAGCAKDCPNHEHNAVLCSDAGAVMSECGRYRYVLWRHWSKQHKCVFIGLNPSTADATQDDPTIRRVTGFAKRWGYGGVFMLNLFALRATDPKEMMAHEYPFGPMNINWVYRMVEEAPAVFCAWGANGDYLEASAPWLKVIQPDKLWCLGTTKAGHPRHPLYLRNDTRPQRYP